MLQIKILDKELYSHEELVPKTVGSAGIDLKLAKDIPDGHLVNYLAPAGIAVAIPEGFVGLILPRSSTGHKRNFRLGNTMGVIDSDYRGQLFMSVAPTNQEFMRGDTVAQLIVVPVVDLSQATIVDDFNHTTDRNEGGFGSTG